MKIIVNIKSDYINTYLLDVDKFDKDKLYKEFTDIYDNSSSFIEFIYNFESNFDNEICDVKNSEYDYFVEIDLHISSYMTYILKNTNKTIDSQIYFNKRINSQGGNCIDRFIRKTIIKNSYTINGLVDDILSRKKDRTNVTNYHDTICFENDFYQITQIKCILEKMIAKCNRQLENMSEKYTSI